MILHQVAQHAEDNSGATEPTLLGLVRGRGQVPREATTSDRAHAFRIGARAHGDPRDHLVIGCHVRADHREVVRADAREDDAVRHLAGRAQHRGPKRGEVHGWGRGRCSGEREPGATLSVQQRSHPGRDVADLGHRIDERLKVTLATTTVLELEARPVAAEKGL